MGSQLFSCCGGLPLGMQASREMDRGVLETAKRDSCVSVDATMPTIQGLEFWCRSMATMS